MPHLAALLADLPLHVDEVGARQLRLELPGFTRVCTEVELRGNGHVGMGEDVIYAGEAHAQLPAHLVELAPELAGVWTFASFSEHLDGLRLFPGEPVPGQEQYRRWALESAALDLALRQAGTSLPAALGLTPRPVRFVLSGSVEKVEQWHAADPSIEYKVDARADWDHAVVQRLRATGAVRVVDLKAHYVGDWIDNAPRPDLYRLVAELLPDALIEDAWLDDATRAALGEGMGRLSWDAPIHGIADIESLAEPPAAINVKPSRFGTVRNLLDTIAWCAARDIPLYGGGQFELGVGRGQIQLLAALFYADAPNDVAPVVFHDAQPGSDVPASPLPVPEIRGFRWG